MADAMMKPIGEANGVKWYWAEPGQFDSPGVYYWNGNRNVLCVPYPAAPTEASNPVQAEARQRARMAERFAGRVPTPATADFDLIAPSDAVQPEAVVQGGQWKLVPVEPTPEMLAAILEPIKWAGGKDAYKAMLAASPAPERVAQIELAIEAGWRAAINTHTQRGMAGWSAYRDEGFEYARQLLAAAGRGEG